MADENQKNVTDDIPSSYIEKFDKISKDSWKHEDFRKKVIEICTEHHNTQDFSRKIEGIFEEVMKKEIFLEKVKSLSGKEIKDYIDKSRIKTVFWIIGLIVAAIIGLAAEKFGHLF